LQSPPGSDERPGEREAAAARVSAGYDTHQRVVVRSRVIERLLQKYPFPEKSDKLLNLDFPAPFFRSRFLFWDNQFEDPVVHRSICLIRIDLLGKIDTPFEAGLIPLPLKIILLSLLGLFLSLALNG